MFSGKPRSDSPSLGTWNCELRRRQCCRELERDHIHREKSSVGDRNATRSAGASGVKLYPRHLSRKCANQSTGELRPKQRDGFPSCLNGWCLALRPAIASDEFCGTSSVSSCFKCWYQSLQHNCHNRHSVKTRSVRHSSRLLYSVESWFLSLQHNWNNCKP